MARKSKAALIRAIKREVDDINYRIMQYEDLLEDTDSTFNPVFVKELEKISDNFLTKVVETKMGIRLQPNIYGQYVDKSSGEIRKKTYEDYEKQLKELKLFHQQDKYSPGYDEELTEKGMRSYNTFRDNNLLGDDFTTADFKEFYNQFNMIKEKAESYGYDSDGATAMSDSAKAYVNSYLNLSRAERLSFGEVVAQAFDELTEEHKEINYESMIKKVEHIFRNSEF